MSWQPPLEIGHNGAITSHVINYARVGFNDVMNVNLNSETIYKISGLVTLAEYSVGVAAVNVNGTGPFSLLCILKIV